MTRGPNLLFLLLVGSKATVSSPTSLYSTRPSKLPPGSLSTAYPTAPPVRGDHSRRASFGVVGVDGCAQPVECVTVAATDPLYILYTSGTTGMPKGVVRDNGGHLVAFEWSMKNVYGVEAGDVYWAASDVGWVVGHSYIVYGPLFKGCTTVLYEGSQWVRPTPARSGESSSSTGQRVVHRADGVSRIKRDDHRLLAICANTISCSVLSSWPGNAATRILSCGQASSWAFPSSTTGGRPKQVGRLARTALGSACFPIAGIVYQSCPRL